MADIREFKALKFNSKKFKDLNEVTSAPYDVISKEEAQKLINKNNYNIIRLEKPFGDDPYNKANKLLNEWKRDKVLVLDDKAGIYIYEQEFMVYKEVKKIKGFICDVKLEEFSKGVILPHENTLSKAKQDRFELMKSTFCNFSQIYSLYIDDEKETFKTIEEASKTPAEIEFTDDNGVIHRLWSVYNKEIIDKIKADFKDRKLYIADGHHRYETALKFRNYCKENGLSDQRDNIDYQMMMLVNMENDGLVVFPTHRIIKGIENFNPEEVIKSCSKFFDIEVKENISEIEKCLKVIYDNNKKSVAFYYGEDKWVLMTLKNNELLNEYLKEKPECIRNLDVTILHSLILERVFGIDNENMANQKNLIYTRELSTAINEVKNKKAQCSFIINPIRVSEIISVAKNYEKMPQKSTYFYPKLITGLVINDLKES